MKINSVRHQAFLHLMNNFQAQRLQRLRLLGRSMNTIGIYDLRSEFRQE